MDRVTEADMEYQNDTNIQTYVSIIELPASRRTHHSVFSLQFFSLHSFKMTRRRDKESSRPSKIGNSWVRRQVYQCPVLGFISGHRWWFRFMHLHLPTPFPLPLSSISYSYCDIIIAYHSSVACHSITTMTGTRRGHLIHSCASTPFIDDVALLLLFPLPPCAPFKPPPASSGRSVLRIPSTNSPSSISVFLEMPFGRQSCTHRTLLQRFFATICY